MEQAATMPRKDILARLRFPPSQAVVALGVLLLFLLFGGALSVAGGESDGRWGYQSAATALMLFGVCNALVSLGTNNVGRYWSVSFGTYAVLAAVAILVARLYSGYWIGEAGSYRWIFMVLTFGYLVLLSIVSMMRGIVSFAEREEWTQPRQRD